MNAIHKPKNPSLVLYKHSIRIDTLEEIMIRHNDNGHTSNKQKKRSMENGALSERRRIIHWIKNILTISHQEAVNLACSHEKEFNELQIIFTEMSCENTQWSRILSIELPTKYYNGFEPSPDSTLKSRTPFEYSPKKQQTHAKLRAYFIGKLYRLLPAAEQQAYSDLLGLRSFDSGLPDDAGAMDSLDLIQKAFLKLYYEFEELEMELAGCFYADGLLWPKALSDLSVLVAEHMGEFIQAIKHKHPYTQPDSLTARLILNASINRAVLELDELFRLQKNALLEMEDIVYLLARVFPDGRINVKNDEIYSLIQKMFALEDEEIVNLQTWRVLTDEIKPLILDMSDRLLHKYCNNQSPERINDARRIHLNPHNKLLMAACLGLAYCTQKVHDLRVSGMTHRTIKVVPGSFKVTNKTVPPSLLAEIIWQYRLLFYSNQHLKRSLFTLKDYSTAAIVNRQMRRRLFVRELKDASLAQWQAIITQLTTLKADYRLRLSQVIQ